MQQKDNFSSKEVANKVDDSITQVDQLRVSGLMSLSQVQQKRLTILKYERDRLSQKNVDDPRIAKLEEQLSYGDQLSTAINLEIAKSRTAVTPLPADAWRTQGNVYYQDNKLAVNVTVFFADDKGQWIKDFGNTCTDSTGFYSLTVDGSLITDASTVGKIPLFLSAKDSKQGLSFQNINPSVPVHGAIDTKDIYFDGKDCPPPIKDVVTT